MDLSSFTHVEVIAHFSDLTKVRYARVYFRTDGAGNCATISTHTLAKRPGDKPGYRRLMYELQRCSYFGDFNDASWANIVEIELSFSAVAGETATWDVYAIYGVVPKAAISIHFDDGYESVYTTAYPIMRRLRLRGDANVNTGSIDTGTRKMTWAHLRELHANGWGVNNHTHSHLNLTTSTVEEIRADLSLSRQILKAEGFSDGANYLICPYGTFDAARWDVYFDYCKAIRTSDVGGLNVTPLPNIYLEDQRGNLETKFTGVTGGTDPPTVVKGYIDELISRKGLCNLNFHKVEDTAGSGTTYNVTEFTEIMEYIAAKRDAGDLIVITSRDLLYQARGPVTVDYEGAAYLQSSYRGLPYSIDLEIVPL